MKLIPGKQLPAKAFAFAVVAVLSVWRVDAQLVDQTVVLSNGWNAVYVSVAPQASADEVFADWPVWSVSAYNAAAFLRTASTTGGATGKAFTNHVGRSVSGQLTAITNGVAVIGSRSYPLSIFPESEQTRMRALLAALCQCRASVLPRRSEA